MKKGYIVMLMLLLMLPAAVSFKATGNANISVTNQTVLILFSGGSTAQLAVTGNTITTQQHSFTFDVNDTTFDYSRIEEIVKNSNATTELKSICQQEIDRGLAAQQAWLTNTFMKSADEFTSLKTEKSDLEFKVATFGQQLKDREQTISILNSTAITQLDNCSEEKTASFLGLGIFAAAVLGMLGLMFKRQNKQKGMMF